jgi:hypothetical protein
MHDEISILTSHWIMNLVPLLLAIEGVIVTRAIDSAPCGGTVLFNRRFNPLNTNGNCMSHLLQQSITFRFVFMGFVSFPL